MIKSDLYPDLAPLTKGASFSQLFDWLYKLAQLRYTDVELSRAVNFKLGTAPKLAKLAELGYLAVKGQAFVITHKARTTLQAEGYNTLAIKADLTGEGGDHALAVARQVWQEMQAPGWYAVLYPSFSYLNPDACLVYRHDSQGGPQARLVFLEVELDKPGQEAYLEDKRSKYERLSADVGIWDKWWRVWSGKLGFGFCGIEEFCWTVKVIDGD